MAVENKGGKKGLIIGLVAGIVVLLAVILLLPRGIVGEIAQRLNARKAGKAALKGVNGNA